MTQEDYTKETQEISSAQLPCRRCESRMFVRYSSARDRLVAVLYYSISCLGAFFHLWKLSQVAILKLEHCVFFFAFGSLLFCTFTNKWSLFFSIRKIRKFYASSAAFFQKRSITVFFLIFLKWIRYLKSKHHSFVKVQISYQMQKNAMFYLQNCDLWKKWNKHLNFHFFKKSQKLWLEEKKNSWIKTTVFHLLHLCPKFQSPRFNSFFFQVE